MGRRGQGGEVQVAHRVHELGRHELGLRAVELDRVEAPRALALGELEQVDPGRLVRRDGVEEARHGVPVGVDEREAAPGAQVVGGEGDELGALARPGPPEQHRVAGEQRVGDEHGAPAVEVQSRAGPRQARAAARRAGGCGPPRPGARRTRRPRGPRAPRARRRPGASARGCRRPAPRPASPTPGASRPLPRRRTASRARRRAGPPRLRATPTP